MASQATLPGKEGSAARRSSTGVSEPATIHRNRRPNIWPGQDLPELEGAFKDLGRLMMDVGLRLTEHCDRYVAACSAPARADMLQQILLRSPCPKVPCPHVLSRF